MRIVIPWKFLASSNTRNSRRGGRAHSWDYKNALEAIELHAMDQVRGERPRFATGVLRARLTFHPPDARKRDVLNYLKVIMDGIEGVVYTDDYQVAITLAVRDAPDRDNPRVEITVEPLEAA